MANDTNLQTLRGIAKRADHDGHVVLLSAEIPFALSRDGVRCLAQLNPAQRLYQLTLHGRKVLADQVPRRRQGQPSPVPE